MEENLMTSVEESMDSASKRGADSDGSGESNAKGQLIKGWKEQEFGGILTLGIR